MTLLVQKKKNAGPATEVCNTKTVGPLTGELKPVNKLRLLRSSVEMAVHFERCLEVRRGSCWLLVDFSVPNPFKMAAPIGKSTWLFTTHCVFRLMLVTESSIRDNRNHVYLWNAKKHMFPIHNALAVPMLSKWGALCRRKTSAVVMAKQMTRNSSCPS